MTEDIFLVLRANEQETGNRKQENLKQERGSRKQKTYFT
jgi:hypothetical protein